MIHDIDSYITWSPPPNITFKICHFEENKEWRNIVVLAIAVIVYFHYSLLLFLLSLHIINM